MARTLHRQVLGHATRRVQEHGNAARDTCVVCGEIAQLPGVRDAGVAGDGVIEAGTFHVPDDTLTTAQARGFGIHGASDVLGGIVPHAFLATKVIGHPLIIDNATRIEGWDQALATSLIPATLPGYTVFSRPDAIDAFKALSGGGGVRLKLPTGVGQRPVAHCRRIAADAGAGLPARHLSRHAWRGAGAHYPAAADASRGRAVRRRHPDCVLRHAMQRTQRGWQRCLRRLGAARVPQIAGIAGGHRIATT